MTTTAEAGAAIDEAAAAADLAAHATRVGQLGRTYSRGVIEFRWVDEEEEEHFEPQVNARLWIELPRRTALRGEKLGRDLLWLGSDPEQFWFFDLLHDDAILYVGRHGDAGLRGTGSPLPIEPLALLDLLGLTEIALPESPRDGSGVGAGAIAEDTRSGCWVITGRGAGGPARLHLDRRTRLPVRVESLSPAGEVLLSSQLRRYRSVPMPGVARTGLPKMPTLIDITDPDGSLSIKLALDQPTGEGADDLWRNVFDLEGLRRYLRPIETHRLGVKTGSR